MFNKTKNDLSAGIVKLDYIALLETAKNAYYLAMSDVQNVIATLNDNDRKKEPSEVCRVHTAQRLEQSVKRLATISETLAALQEGTTREDKLIVNVPPIKD